MSEVPLYGEVDVKSVSWYRLRIVVVAGCLCLACLRYASGGDDDRDELVREPEVLVPCCASENCAMVLACKFWHGVRISMP